MNNQNSTGTLSNNKRIAKNTLFLYFRMFFIMAVSLYTSRIVLRTLGVEDYGIYNVVGGVIAMLSFLNGAMSNATQRNISYELGKANEGNQNLVFCTSLNIHILISIILLIIAESIGVWFLNTKMVIPEERIVAANYVFQFAILTSIVSVLSVPYNATIIAHERMNAFAYISIIEVLLKLGIVFLLTLGNIDKLILYSVLTFLVQTFIRFIYGTYCQRNFTETKYNFVHDKKLFNEMFAFAGWNLLGNLAILAVTQGLNLVLNLFFGPVVNAARGVAVQVQSSLNGFCSNIQMAINPQITKSYARNDQEYLNFLIKCSSKISFFVLFFISLPIIIELPTVLTLWLGDYPDYSVPFIRIILSVAMIDALSNSLVTAINATGNIKKYQIYIGLLLISVLPISYVILEAGIQNPCIVFIIHLVLNSFALLLRFYFVKSLLGIGINEYVRDVIGRIAVTAIVCFTLPIIITFFLESSCLRLVINIFISLFFSSIIILYIGLTKKERQLAITAIKKKIHRHEN